MLVFADYITWTVDPIAVHWPVEVRWYGLCFLACIFTCIAIMKPLFREIGRDPEEAVSVTIHVVIGIIVGSRLMHCFAYDPHLYLSDPIRIFKIWEGGLASHGGAIGALVAGYIWVNGLIYKAAAWLSPRSPEWLRVVETQRRGVDRHVGKTRRAAAPRREGMPHENVRRRRRK